MKLLQLLPQFYRFPVRDLVHQCPKTVAVLHLYGVAKFVKEDVVDQVPGLEHPLQTLIAGGFVVVFKEIGKIIDLLPFIYDMFTYICRRSNNSCN